MFLRVVMMNDSSSCRLLNDFLVMLHIIVIIVDSTPVALGTAYDTKNDEENKANDDADNNASSTAGCSIVRIWQSLAILIVVVIIQCAIIDYDHGTE